MSTRMMFGTMLVIAVLACIVAQAENIVFPYRSRILDVTKAPFNADKTGRMDATRALQWAIDKTDTLRHSLDVPAVYLPNGTYLVSNTIRWKLPYNTYGPHMWGQSRAGTVIRLKDGTWPMGTEGKAVLHTGDGVAQNFWRGIHNLTVSVGSNNAGAWGIYFYGNNESLMSDVNIRSEDGKGRVGLHLGVVEQGPAGARNIHIKGFDIGVLSAAKNSFTIWRLSLEGQNICGIQNSHHPLYIDSLTSNNSVPAVINRSNGMIALIDASLSGGSPAAAAIVNDAGCQLFARNIIASGYRRAIQNNDGFRVSPSGSAVPEYVSHASISLFNSPQRSLNLPKKYPPEPVWESDTARWAIVDSTMLAGRTLAQALQAALDDKTKTTVCLTAGKQFAFGPADTVYIRGTTSRILTAGAELSGGKLIMIVQDAVAGPPAVKTERFTTGGGSMSIICRTGRTVILESMTVTDIALEGAGDLFVSDIVTPVAVRNANAHLWGWQYNAEAGGSTINLDVSSGTAWIFGWKDEGDGTSVRMTGGTAEVIGFLNYAGCTPAKPDSMAQFSIANAAFSVAGATQLNYCNTYYHLLARETHGGQTRELRSENNPNRYDLPLFTAYTAPIQKRLATAVDGELTAILSRLSGRTLQALLIVPAPGRVIMELITARGQVAQTWTSAYLSAGVHEIGYILPVRPHGIYYLRFSQAGNAAVKHLLVM